mmetsp:Transcript_1501/g.2401  ORF Transcript_1501/g.2401 Transcript_1501/m.2401 type:complete len:138 (+) Transcript_1501:305-718(+)
MVCGRQLGDGRYMLPGSSSFWNPPTSGPTSCEAEFEVVGIEAIQVSQNLKSTVPLVEGKRTLIRVYIQRTLSSGTSSDPGTIPDVTLTLKHTSSSGKQETLEVHRSLAIIGEITDDVLNRRKDKQATVNYEFSEGSY